MRCFLRLQALEKFTVTFQVEINLTTSIISVELSHQTVNPDPQVQGYLAWMVNGL